MNELVIIVEGETEQAFVRGQLAAHLPLHGTTVWPVLPGRHRCHGGVKKWEVARQDIVRTLKEKRYCSTMFDYNGMPNDWPGRAESARKPWNERAIHVEKEILTEITTAMGSRFDSRYFIPYVQLHEFEALVFADVEKLVSVVLPVAHCSAVALTARFTEIVDESGHPEAINDGSDTSPSHRIAHIVPAYKKRLHGPIVTRRAGLDILRGRCDHFASWLERLENIGTEPD